MSSVAAEDLQQGTVWHGEGMARQGTARKILGTARETLGTARSAMARHGSEHP